MLLVYIYIHLTTFESRVANPYRRPNPHTILERLDDDGKAKQHVSFDRFVCVSHFTAIIGFGLWEGAQSSA